MRWDKEVIAANTLLVADWLQTKDIADSPEYYERNIILGKYPTQREVDEYFLLSILTYNLLVVTLPDKYERILTGGVIILEVGMVVNNISIGVGFKF